MFFHSMPVIVAIAVVPEHILGEPMTLILHLVVIVLNVIVPLALIRVIAIGMASHSILAMPTAFVAVVLCVWSFMVHPAA